MRLSICCTAMVAAWGALTTACWAQSPDLAVCTNLKDQPASIRACNRIIESNIATRESRFTALTYRAATYVGQGDLDRAIADYDEAIRLDPQSAVVFSTRGFAYFGKRDFDHAIADFNEAIRLDGKLSEAYRGRGAAYVLKGDNDRGIADFNELIRLDSKNSIAYRLRGDAHFRKNNLDYAIGDYSEAIRLNPNDETAYQSRAITYRIRSFHGGGPSDIDRGIYDFSEVIRLDPKRGVAFLERGDTYFAKGDYDRAIADYNEAIRLDPKHAKEAYRNRGHANLYSGALAKALADFNQVSELSPKDAYVALWLDIANNRSNLPSRLADATRQIDMTEWPAPIIRLYLGQLTPEAVLAAADDPNADTKKHQVCEANFYTGELALQHGAKDEATRLFRLAAADCPKTFDEYEAAVAELRAIGATP
jgi:lipoprotein NlpI